MTRKSNTKIISVVHPICCGLDVHKNMVSACIIITEPDGEESFVIKEFSTFTDDLYRLKAWLSKSLTDYKRRVHKLFETANIKISAVVSDLFGKTGRNLINTLIVNQNELNVEHVEQCAKGRLKQKTPELFRAIHGFFEAHHRFQLKMMMQTIAHFESEIEAITKRLDRILDSNQGLIDQLDEVPGIDKKTAQSIIGHIGDTLTAFRSEKALASWGGLCPGNNESAGKRKSGRSPVRKHPFKELMVEIAWAAIRTKGSYYKDKYYRLKSRRGAKRAIVAIAHRITKAVYYIIKHGRSYVDLGEAYLMSKSKEKRFKILKLKAKHLGYNLVPATTN